MSNSEELERWMRIEKSQHGEMLCRAKMYAACGRITGCTEQDLVDSVVLESCYDESLKEACIVLGEDGLTAMAKECLARHEDRETARNESISSMGL